MAKPRSKPATKAAPLSDTLPLDETGIEATPVITENNGTDRSALLEAAIRRFIAVPFTERDYMLLVMAAIQLFDYRAPADMLYEDIQYVFDEAGMPKMKAGANYKELLRSLEQLGFIECGSILDGNIRFDAYYLTDIGESLQSLDYSQAIPPRVFYVVERYLRSSRTMTPGAVMSLSELVARVISTQTIQLSAHMQLFTPKTAHDVVLQALAKRFNADELLVDVEANTVSILQNLDPGRGGKSRDIWVI